MDLFGFGARQPLRAFLGTLLCLLAGSAVAQPAQTLSDSMRISGFGTLGLVHADAPDGWGFRRGIDQPAHGGGTRADIDSRFGLQVNYAPTPQFELVAQLLATRRSHYASDSDSIEWAFAAYRPVPDVALRVGRLNLDQFLMSDYRNVGFAYRFARPPVEFYASLPTSLDGADLAKVWNVDGIQWRAKAFIGRAHSGDLSRDGSTQLRPVYGAMVSREDDGLLLRVGLTHAGLPSHPPALQPLLDGLSSLSTLPVPQVAAQAAALRSQLDFAGSHATYATAAFSYELQDWQWSAEYAHETGHPAVRFDAAYAGVGRRFGPVTLFGGVSRIHSAQRNFDVSSWSAALAPVIGAAGAQQAQYLGAAAAFASDMSAANQRTLSLGARWDVHPQLALKFEWDAVRIGTGGGRLWANATAEAGHANVASLVLDFVF